MVIAADSNKAKVGNEVIGALLPRPIGCESKNSQGMLRNVKILQEGRHLCDQKFFIDFMTVFFSWSLVVECVSASIN